ncbi:MAG: ATP-dependent DNA helicase RecG [Thermodesulfobacteriota bacterium]
MAEWGHIVQAITKPLIFASRNGFANLPLMKGLEKLIEGLGYQALSLELAQSQKRLIRELLEIFSGFEGSSIEEKKDCIARSMKIMVQLEGYRDEGKEKVEGRRENEGLRIKSEEVRREEAEEKGKPEVGGKRLEAKVKGKSRALSQPIQFVKGVGPRIAKKLEKRGVRTIEDALYFLPRRYEDRRVIKKISEIQVGKLETVLAEVLLSGTVFYKGNRKRVFEAVVADGTGTLTLKWFRGSEEYLKSRFRKGRRVIISGEVRLFRHQKEIHHPDMEVADHIEDDPLHFKRIVPIYPEPEGLYQKTIRKIMKGVVDNYVSELTSPIPDDIIRNQKLMDFGEAIRHVHFPPEDVSLEEFNLKRSDAHRRIVFDEFFFVQLGLALRRSKVTGEEGIPFQILHGHTQRLLKSLHFQLTPAQERVLSEIEGDMRQPHPMNRLIQGDVGSGKTIVALMATLMAVENGFQASFMAPTEILAEQHFLTIRRLVRPLGIRPVLLTSSVKGSEREEIQHSISSGEGHIVIGTHALIQEHVKFQRLGLLVIDEQHKFGVIQRAALRRKGKNPDVLVMTATPIPRTLALTVYGDLAISVIDEFPPGRVPIETRLYYERERRTVYELVKEEIRRGRQAFLVYPLVEESDKVDLLDATRMADHLQRDIFPQFRVGLIHGRMKGEEKEEVMVKFRDGQIDILVATTVIEVGIDIPNASLILVEHAERFGLPQLHQLRGRIGRGRYPSKCLLLAHYRRSEEATRRLRVMEETHDGFRIAEEDLIIRGPGDFLGTRQSGLPDFHVANILRDGKILNQARQEAFSLVEKDLDLSQPGHRPLAEALKERWRGRLELVRVG